MTTNLTDRPLITLCRGQHYTVLDLLRQVIKLERDPQSAAVRRQLIQGFRQKLSRHLQLMRHVFFPPLRRMALYDQVLERRVKQFEEATQTLLPRITNFIHASERDPQSLNFAEARTLMGILKAHFEQEQRHLHVLYIRHVPKAMEQQQLQIFRKRLVATVSKNSPSRDTVAAPMKIPHMPPTAIGQPTGSAKVNASTDPEKERRRASLKAMEREAITRPVEPGEEVWDPLLGAVGQ